MRPRVGCKMCEDFYLKYPVIDNETGSEIKMASKYFPDAKVR